MTPPPINENEKTAVLATMCDIAQKLADSCKKNNPKSNLDPDDFYNGWSKTCGRDGNSLFSTHIMLYSYCCQKNNISTARIPQILHYFSTGKAKIKTGYFNVTKEAMAKTMKKVKVSNYLTPQSPLPRDKLHLVDLGCQVIVEVLGGDIKDLKSMIESVLHDHERKVLGRLVSCKYIEIGSVWAMLVFILAAWTGEGTGAGWILRERFVSDPESPYRVDRAMMDTTLEGNVILSFLPGKVLHDRAEKIIEQARKQGLFTETNISQFLSDHTVMLSDKDCKRFMEYLFYHLSRACIDFSFYPSLWCFMEALRKGFDKHVASYLDWEEEDYELLKTIIMQHGGIEALSENRKSVVTHAAAMLERSYAGIDHALLWLLKDRDFVKDVEARMTIKKEEVGTIIKKEDAGTVIKKEEAEAVMLIEKEETDMIIIKEEEVDVQVNASKRKQKEADERNTKRFKGLAGSRMQENKLIQ